MVPRNRGHTKVYANTVVKFPINCVTATLLWNFPIWFRISFYNSLEIHGTSKDTNNFQIHVLFCILKAYLCARWKLIFRSHIKLFENLRNNAHKINHLKRKQSRQTINCEFLPLKYGLKSHHKYFSLQFHSVILSQTVWALHLAIVFDIGLLNNWTSNRIE